MQCPHKYFLPDNEGVRRCTQCGKLAEEVKNERIEIKTRLRERFQSRDECPHKYFLPTVEGGGRQCTQCGKLLTVIKAERQAEEDKTQQMWPPESKRVSARNKK